ncbi:M3 family oligoendopeptidase [Fusibacter tunisiensis]|uniref:M3 family oligoendopeptidase n=1 Tax=Fusibacter tunisiensis TaxID=1008308 RepID=A0ABS2MU92_9FIRM|nr:M3 family oligoendopeptidase [Fusibacter tunisiensis]MBM7562964.1 M3 family oligoendopeptidase [Fusibacter tunisiensis]
MNYAYKRPDMAVLQQNFNQKIEAFSNAKTAEEQVRIITEINALRNDVETAFTLVSIRHSINTEDAFYDAENDFMDENAPLYQELVDRYYRAIAASPYQDQLRKAFGDHLFNLIDVNLKTFKPEIMEDLKQENALASKYTKLRASAKIQFDGEERNLAQMGPYYESKDPDVRKAAQEAVSAFFVEKEAEFDAIYHDLVQVRTRIARKLGYENFVEVGYMRLNRTDYDRNDVASYRKQVLRDIVPIATRLRARQKERLGLDTLKYYDEPLAFTTGNATPKGDGKWILENGKHMYEALSKESSEFINFMIDNELLDLESKKGKAGGGYCTFIPNYKAPFIFSNFNGTSGDVDVLTHEAGHAFQVYQSRNYELPEYVWPTLEACEIHSMSMEFITYPWMESFFKEETEKYKFSHVSEAILFIPYGVLVDDFQHFVYENPEMTPAERKAKWRELEKQYLPHRDYAGNDFLERGGYWFRQGHIFGDPFYYIDYTLAQVCAFQFFVKLQENRETAWQDYLRLCNKGGSLPFTELIKVANLQNPFEEGSIKGIVPTLEAWLNGIDDKKLDKA